MNDEIRYKYAASNSNQAILSAVKETLRMRKRQSTHWEDCGDV